MFYYISGKVALTDAAMEVSNALIAYDAEVQKEVSRDKQIMSLYNENQDLISIGAYKSGTNPELDYAIRPTTS